MSTSSSIHSFLILTASIGRRSVRQDQRNKTWVRYVAEDTTLNTSGSSDQWTAGIGETMGGAKTLETRAMGLCWIYPAQTAKSMISRVRMITRLSVACFPDRSIERTVLMTRGAVIWSIWRLPKVGSMKRSKRLRSSLYETIRPRLRLHHKVNASRKVYPLGASCPISSFFRRANCLAWARDRSGKCPSSKSVTRPLNEIRNTHDFLPVGWTFKDSPKPSDTA